MLFFSFFKYEIKNEVSGVNFEIYGKIFQLKIKFNFIKIFKIYVNCF